jgi:Tfp pilus assembly protein PilN
MADTVGFQILQDGPRNVVAKWTDVSDGTGQTNFLALDVDTLSGFNGLIPDAVRIERIDYSLEGMSVKILWDATVPVLAWEITPDADNTLHFKQFGGLVNNAGAGKTGDILFTTIGASAGDSYSIVLSMVKHYTD